MCRVPFVQKSCGRGRNVLKIKEAGRQEVNAGGRKKEGERKGRKGKITHDGYITKRLATRKREESNSCFR